MSRSSAAAVKRERRKSLFLQEFSSLFQEIYLEQPVFADIYVSKVDLSNDTGICYVYFATFKEPGEEVFLKALDVLKLYKPSLRKAFAGRIDTRYAPDLVFVFDKGKAQERRINELLDKVADLTAPKEPPADQG